MWTSGRHLEGVVNSGLNVVVFIATLVLTHTKPLLGSSQSTFITGTTHYFWIEINNSCRELKYLTGI